MLPENSWAFGAAYVRHLAIRGGLRPVACRTQYLTTYTIPY